MSVWSGPPAIEARGVRRVYNVKPTPVVALDGIDLDVAPGEFFGLLGPNGAGKTTLIKILTTLLLPSAGTARIFGFDVAGDVKRIRRIMNMVAGGEQSGYGILTVREQLWMFSQFYGLPRKDGWRRVDELIEAVGFGDQAQQRVSTLSTGERQKMNFARGLLNDPWILFLDEPTLGLDVAAARSVRELVTSWKAAVPGRTVLLTTHYMAEADELCERIAIVDHGRILAIGSPEELKLRVQRESIFRLELDRLDGGADALARLPGVVSAAPAAEVDDGVERQTVASTSFSRRTARWAASSGRSAAWAPTSSRCASPSRRSRTSSSSSSGAASTTTAGNGRHPGDGGATPTRTRDQLEHEVGERRPMSEPVLMSRSASTGAGRDDPVDPPTGAGARCCSPTCGRSAAAPIRGSPDVPREVVDVLRDPPAVHRHVGVRLRLPLARAPPEYVGFVVLGGAMTAFWLNVMWMMASQLYWEKSQGNLELIRGAHELHVDPVRDGRRRDGHEHDQGHRHPRRLAACTASTFSVDQWLLLAVVFAAHADRPLRAGHDAREPLPGMGPRGRPAH